MRRYVVRRGQAVVQWIVVAALIFLAVYAGVTLLGPNTSSKLNQTATDVGNPKSLTTRFSKGS
jgi:uncharacterized membrane protein YjfL (UPF0719 family)